MSNLPPPFFAKLTSVRYGTCLLKKPIPNCRAKERPLNLNLTHHYSKEGFDKCRLYLHYLVLWYLGENISFMKPKLFHFILFIELPKQQYKPAKTCTASYILTSQRIRENKIKLRVLPVAMTCGIISMTAKTSNSFLFKSISFQE